MEISADSHSSITYDSTMTQSAGDLKYLARATEYARALEVCVPCQSYNVLCFVVVFFLHANFPANSCFLFVLIFG